MSDTAVVLNISEMIDLAIGTPEVGVVDFNMLQTVLHCLAQQQRVLAKNVEVRGSIVSMPINRDHAQTINITEYAVDTDDDGISVKKDVAPPPAQGPKEDTILVVERIKKDPPKESPTRSGSDTVAGAAGAESKRSSISKDQASRSRKDSRPTNLSPREKLSLVTMSKFNVLENVVVDLRKRVYGSMPKNEDMLEEVRSQANVNSITDMWTNINVSSRLEAAEAGIGKLSSLIQDIINDTQKVAAAAGVTSALRIDAATDFGLDMLGPDFTGPGAVPGTGVAKPGTGVAKSGASTGTGAATPGSIPPAFSSGGPVGPLGALLASGKLASKDDIIELNKHFKKTRDHLASLKDIVFKALKEINPNIQLNEPTVSMGSLASYTAEGFPTADQDKWQGEGLTFGGSAMGFGGGGGAPIGPELEQRLCDLEKRFKTCCNRIAGQDANKEQISSVQDQVEYLSKQVSNLSTTGANNALSPNLVKDLQGLMQLFETVHQMQDQLKNVHETALQLAAEKHDRQSYMNSILEQIEMLKAVKMDREDIAEAMAEKADLRMLARKVSHDQFELACDDLSRGLEHALGKLGMQEALWQQALDDIQREIETKLDKMELTPVRDFFNGKLKQLQENLKQMATLRREAEAAGTKRKLMRDVNCISCDANAVMSMEAPPSLPMAKPLPATISMKPYLSYELDTIRKTQASQLPQRNMHDWENIDKQMTLPKHSQKARSGTDKHLCNRYCGGSHTTTTAAQRVARLGHFMKQWGPDVLPLSSGYAAGDDGKMYKISTGQSANVGPGGAVDAPCSPKPPTEKAKRPDLPSEKPELPSMPECKCLDASARSNK